MTARARKKPPLVMPPLACQVPACGQEYAPIGDYADTADAARLGGWQFRVFGEVQSAYQIPPLVLGEWLCPAHKDQLPWWPGRRLLALPQREPGATRAEFLGVVPRAALPAPEPHLEPLPQRTPAWPPARVLHMPCGCPYPKIGDHRNCEHGYPGDDEEPQPGGTIYPDLTPEALAEAVPLDELAPAQEDEAQA